MELIWIPLIGLYVYSIYVCFQKGKPRFGWVGIAGLFPLFAPFLVWFPIVGALRPGKPGSRWVLDGEQAGSDVSFVAAPPPAAPEFDHIADPTEATHHGPDQIVRFLDQAVAAGVIPTDVRHRLLAFHTAPPAPAPEPVRERRPDPVADFVERTPPPRHTDPPARHTTRPAAPVPTVADFPPPRVSAPPPTRMPQPDTASAPSPFEERVSRLGERAAALWEAVSSDIALHGLAYLGVLLTFVGVLGFLLFAFQDVPNSVQPLVEAFIASVFFGWAWVLRRQQASTVANALELIGGMTLPLILFAGFVDEAPIPPDASGGALVATMTITSLALAGVFAFIAGRRPDSMLRFLVAPMLWLGALALGFVFKTDEPLRGVAITNLVSAQPALASIAVAAVLAIAGRGWFPKLQRSAILAGLIGVPAAYALTLGLATAEGWSHPEAGVVAGLATIVSVHAVAGYFDRTRWAFFATPVLLAGAIAPLIEITGLAWAGMVAAVTYLAVIEWIAQREEPDPILWIMAGTGATIGLAMSLAAAPATIFGFAAASLWAHRRRVTGIPIDGSDDVLTAGAAALPIGVGWGIWELMAPHPALLVMATILFAVALSTRRLDSEDIFWSLWPPALALIVAGRAVDPRVFTSISPQGADPVVLLTLALVAATIGLGRRWAVLRLLLTAAVAVVAMLPYTGTAWGGAAAAIGYLAVLEWIAQRDEPDRIVWIMAAGGGAIGLAMSLGGAPAAVLGFTAASLWAHRRRVTGIPIDGAADVMTAAAAALPIGVGWGIWELMAPHPALLVMATILFAVALITRRLDSEDIFWSLWPPALALIVAGLAINLTVGSAAAEEGPEYLAPMTLVLVAATVGLGRRWPELRLWLAGGTTAVAVALGLEGAAASSEIRALVWVVSGLAAVLIAGLSRRTLANHLAAVGHITLTGALFVRVDGATFAAVMWAWSIGWAWALVAASRRRGSLTRLLVGAVAPASPAKDYAETALPWIVPALFASSVPVATLATANLWDEFVSHRSWTGVALSFLAIAYAAATRWVPGGEPLRRVLAVGAAAMAVLGVAIAAPEAWPTILATGSTLVVALSLAADDRQTAFSWFAWLMSGVMAMQLAERAGVAAPNLYLVSLTWGGVLFLGGLIADDVVAGRRARGAGLRVRWARYPVFVGALAVPASLAPVVALDATVLGWSALAAAGGYFVVAALMRAGLATAPGYALGAVAAVALSPWSILEDPALLPIIGAVLVGAAAVARRLQPEEVADDAWLSWEIAPLAVAHLVGAVALAVAHATPNPEITWFLLGAVATATAVWRRRGLWLDAGIVMFVVGAGYVGLGALALALAAVSLRALIGAYLSDGTARTIFHGVAVGAAAASWLTVLVRQEWQLSLAVSNSALLFGLGTLAVAVLSRFDRIRRDSTVAWGALTATGVLVSGFLGAAAQATHGTGGGEPGIVGLGLALGLAALAISLEVAAKPLDGFSRYWAVVMAGLSWLSGLVGTARSVDSGVVLTSIVGGTLALAVVELARRFAREPNGSESPPDLTIFQAWVGLGTASVFVAIGTALATVANRSTWQYGIAMGLMLVAIAAARGAGPLSVAGLREASGLIGLAALMAFLYGAGAGATSYVIVVLIVAAATSVAILRVADRRADSVWLPPLEWLAVAANLTAVGFAATTVPDRSMIATVLLAGGIQAIAVGVGLDRLALLAAGPPAMATAFVLTVAEAVSGSVQWYTTPLALVILAEVEIVRLRQDDASQLMATHQLSALEWSGIALITVPAVVEMFFRGPFAGLLLFLVAALLLLWSILTRIRRRAVAAAAVATGSAVMMVSSALTLGAPDSAAFWIIAVGLGFAVMAVAGIIEASRSRQGRFVRRFDQLMDGWA